MTAERKAIALTVLSLVIGFLHNQASRKPAFSERVPESSLNLMLETGVISDDPGSYPDCCHGAVSPPPSISANFVADLKFRQACIEAALTRPPSRFLRKRLNHLRYYAL
jgi:hypothetical protein